MPDTVQIDTTFSRLKSRSSSWFQEFEERFNRTLLNCIVNFSAEIPCLGDNSLVRWTGFTRFRKMFANLYGFSPKSTTGWCTQLIALVKDMCGETT